MLVSDISEVVRAGDVFLAHFNCPKCKQELFEGVPIKGLCHQCGLDLETIALSVNSASKRLLAGSKRKQVSVSKKIIRMLQSIQNNHCAYCSTELGNYHVDHVWPLAAGGTNRLSNLVLSCPPCNLHASSFVFNSLDAKRRFIIQRRKLEREDTVQNL